MKRALVIGGLSILVGAGLVFPPALPRHTASPVPAPARAEASLPVSKPLAALPLPLPTPTPVQARREPQRRASPASRSRKVVVLPSILLRIRGCESGDGPNTPGDYSNVNSNSGASGAYQFLDSTWAYVTRLPGKARDYSKATQDRAAIKLYESEGTTPWNSSRYCWS